MSHSLQENLTNLHNFWSAMAHSQQHGLHQHDSWPYKAWQSNFKLAHLLELQEKVFVTTELPKNMAHYKIKTQLTAMSLTLNDVTAISQANIEQVKQSDKLSAWATACGSAFGYAIDEKALLPLLLNESATLFSYIQNKQIAGTAICYKTKSTMGVHQVGVLPNFQGQGIGNKLMQHLVYVAKQQGCELMTLQASSAGTPLYLKMGFKKELDIYHLVA